MDYETRPQVAELIRVLDHGNNVQLLCQDDRGLLSLYLEPENYKIFDRLLVKAGVEIKGAKLQFNRDLMRVMGKGRKWSRCVSRKK